MYARDGLVSSNTHTHTHTIAPLHIQQQSSAKHQVGASSFSSIPNCSDDAANKIQLIRFLRLFNASPSRFSVWPTTPLKQLSLIRQTVSYSLCWTPGQSGRLRWNRLGRFSFSIIANRSICLRITWAYTRKESTSVSVFQ